MTEQNPQETTDRSQQPESSRPLTDHNSKRKNWQYFALGFVAWYVINGLAWWLIPQNAGGNAITGLNPILLLCLPSNFFGMLILTVIQRTRWISYGLLAAFSLNLLVSLVLGMFTQAVCMAPFFLTSPLANPAPLP